MGPSINYEEGTIMSSETLFLTKAGVWPLDDESLKGSGVGLLTITGLGLIMKLSFLSSIFLKLGDNVSVDVLRLANNLDFSFLPLLFIELALLGYS